MHHVKNSQSIHTAINWWFMHDKTFYWKAFTVFVTKGREKVIWAGGHKKVNGAGGRGKVLPLTKLVEEKGLVEEN